MSKELKVIPTFKTEDEEREFWASQDSTDYVDWDEAEAITLPKLKPSTRTISLRYRQQARCAVSILDQDFLEGTDRSRIETGCRGLCQADLTGSVNDGKDLAGFHIPTGAAR